MARPRNAPDGMSTSTDSSAGKQEMVRAAVEEFIHRSSPDDLIPSERVLAEQFQVARMTVRAAIDSLELRGLLRRVPGKGSFVQAPLLAQRATLRSFTEDMRSRGMTPGVSAFTISTLAANDVVAEKLALEKGAPTFLVERVRTADGTPMALERIQLSSARFPTLPDHMTQSDSLYAVLAAQFGIHVDSADQSVTIAELNAADARRLEAETGAPCFAVVHRSVDPSGQPIEFGRSFYRGDRYAFEFHLNSQHRPHRP